MYNAPDGGAVIATVVGGSRGYTGYRLSRFKVALIGLLVNDQISTRVLVSDNSFYRISL